MDLKKFEDRFDRIVEEDTASFFYFDIVHTELVDTAKKAEEVLIKNLNNYADQNSGNILVWRDFPITERIVDWESNEKFYRGYARLAIIDEEKVKPQCQE
jgi:hypothetical protein